MEIQQKDSEALIAYIHRFKKEAKHCDFDSHPAKIRIFLKGLINSSRIAPNVYKKGPTTIEDAISIVEKISSAQRIAASFSQNHQISMMKRGPNEHHAPNHHHAPTHQQPINQDCSNCGQLGHPWFTCPHIICDGCNQRGHSYRHCWDRIPPSGTSSPQENHHSHDHRALDTPQVDVMTGEAEADPMLGYTRETEVQVVQDTPAQTDTPAGTETQDGDTCLTATEPRAVHPTDSDQAITDHRLRTPGITPGAGHPHVAAINHIDVA